MLKAICAFICLVCVGIGLGYAGGWGLGFACAALLLWIDIQVGK